MAELSWSQSCFLWFSNVFYVSLIEIGDFVGNPQGCGNSMELPWGEIKLGSQLNAV